MIRLLDLREVALTHDSVSSFVPRVVDVSSGFPETVRGLMEAVRRDGAEALTEQTREFDGVTGVVNPVESSWLKSSAKALDKDLRRAMEEAIHRVREASQASVPAGTLTTFHQGGSVRMRYVPIERAGVYVPGGKAVYPSSVIMNVVAAQAAGVAEIALVSPPQASHDGHIHPSVAAAAHLLGIREVYAVGGAGAIAALAYGVEQWGLRPVQVITGPGNRYVAMAKTLVRDRVGIDSEAGPTEIGVIADDGANPEFIAADLISQAEHDEQAQAVLMTPSMELATRVQAAIERQVADTPHRSRVLAALGGEQSALVVVDSLDVAVMFSNALAPEHLELVVDDPEALLPGLVHAGAIFVGDYTPVSAGDYLAGSNHVLPTGGAARFSSGLSPLSFLRTQQVVTYDKDALAQIAPLVETFARAENLPAHADAISKRFIDD